MPFYFFDDEKALSSSFNFKFDEKDTEIHTKFELNKKDLKHSNGSVFASIETLYYENGVFNAKIVSPSHDDEWVVLNGTYKIEFNSYDGGGPKYSVTISNEDILRWYSYTKYPTNTKEKGSGETFKVEFYFSGRNPGTAKVEIIKSFLGDEDIESTFNLVVDENYQITRVNTK